MEREKDLLDRLYRRGRRLNLARRILSIVFLISGFIFAPTWVHLQLTYAPPNLALDYIDVVSLVTGYIATISYIGLVVMSRWARADMEKRGACREHHRPAAETGIGTPRACPAQ